MTDERAWNEVEELEAMKSAIHNKRVALENPETGKGSEFFTSGDPGRPDAIAHVRMNNPADAELVWVASQKPGEGRRLIQQSVDWAKKQGAGNITGSARPRAAKLFQRMGGKQWGREDPFTDQVPVRKNLVEAPEAYRSIEPPLKPKPGSEEWLADQLYQQLTEDLKRR